MAVKNKNQVVFSRETIGYYWQEIKKYKLSFIFAVVFIPLASVLLGTIIPYLISLAIGSLSEADYQSFQNYILPISLTVVVGVLANLIGFQSIIVHESSVRASLATNTLRKLLQKDQGFFANQKIGSLTGKYIDFINGHVALQNLMVGEIISFIINIFLGLFLIWQKTPLLAGIVLLLVLGLMIQVKFSRALRSHLRLRRKELISEVNGLAADIITNNTTVKTFASEKHELSALNKINQAYKDAYWKDMRWQSVEGSSRILVMQSIQIIAIVIIGNLLVSNQIQLSIAIFVIIYLQRLSTQLFSLGEIIFGYDKIMLQASPMTEILMEPVKIVDDSNEKMIVDAGEISFKDVSYAYSDNDQELVLSNFSLTIQPGQKVGLVGYSGAGKTTLTKLLLRFDDLKSGTIEIDGFDISKITQASLRKSISYVPQEPMLFHRSLRENIKYGKINATDEEVIDATKLANAYDFIAKLPNGLDTVVGERGVKLSGGQRQRIAIARAILKNAPILILDEATSALDSESELLIQKSLNYLMSSRTSIVVAHRLSTISKLDRIIVIEQGKMVEDGTHTELIARDGQYAKLWKHQSGGFID